MHIITKHMDMQAFYKGKKVLITGHTGFKGSWLAQILLTLGADVVGLSLPPEGDQNLFNILKLGDKVNTYFGDIREFGTLQDLLERERPEIVFHLAAQALVIRSYANPLETFSSNVMGTANILEAVKGCPSVRSVVIVTTDKVYENKEWVHPYRENDPLGGYDPYSASKGAADIVANSYIQSFFNPEDYGTKHNTLVSIVRAGNVIGGGDWAANRLIPDIMRSVHERSEPVTIRSPHAVRPWEHVMEPLAGYLMLGEGLYNGRKDFSGAWNFGPSSDSFITVGDLVTEAVRILGRGEIDMQATEGVHEAQILRLDITKATVALGWRPRFDLRQNLEQTFDWYKRYYAKSDDMQEFTNKQIKDYFELK